MANTQIVLDDQAPLNAPAFYERYVDALSLVERLHRLLLDVIKDEFERLGNSEINSVQALLLFNIGEEELSAGELRTRGYYQGSNVSYNVKKLVESGYLHHQRSEFDRRAVRISLTDKGRAVRDVVCALLMRHAEELAEGGAEAERKVVELNEVMRELERYWRDQIRFIY